MEVAEEPKGMDNIINYKVHVILPNDDKEARKDTCGKMGTFGRSLARGPY